MKIIVTGVVKIEQKLKEFPPQIKSFNKDKLFYIIHKLVGGPLEESQVMEPKQLFASLLQDIIGNEYKHYLVYLLQHQIIETNNQYIVGQHSRKYRLCSEYWGKPEMYTIRKKTLQKRLQKAKWNNVRAVEVELEQPEEALNSIEAGEYDYLSKWMPGLQIDVEAAEGWATSYWMQKVIRPKAKDQKKYGKSYRSNVDQEYFNRLKIIEYFKSEERPMIIDQSGYRLHSLLTRCPRELRHFLSYKGQPLVGIDIKNCQPFLLNVLFNIDFWEEKNNPIYERAIYGFFEEIEEAYPFMILNLKKKELLEELKEYKRLSKSGELYESLIDFFPRPLSKNNSASKNREIVKTRMMLYLYGSYEINSRGMNMSFGNKFPILSDIIFHIKAENPVNMMALILQRIESYLILEKVCPRIALEHPEIPIFTIHDSIVTTEGNEAIVQNIINEVFLDTINLTPALKIEPFNATIPAKKLKELEKFTISALDDYPDFSKDDFCFLLA